jgi:dTDP-4-dehydrorhamnose 3,5-epimerase
MIVTETALAGAYTIDVERHEDERGHFGRVFCSAEFAAHGLELAVVQASVSYNHRRGTLRGLHFQFPPAAETKYVRCTRGAIFDVIVDLRPESPTYLRHVSAILSADNARGFYIPRRCAHGFLTLADETEVSYLIGEPYVPNAAGGLHYADPQLAIAWPAPVQVISERDRTWPPIAATCDQRLAKMDVTTAA